MKRDPGINTTIETCITKGIHQETVHRVEKQMPDPVDLYELADLFKLFGAEVWGVSGDDEASHRSFADKNKLPFPLLCDTENSLRRAFGVPKVLGLLDGRVTYIIDSKGVIRHIFNDLYEKILKDLQIALRNFF